MDAAQLVDRYRTDQAKVASHTTATLALAWRKLMDVGAVDRTFPAFLSIALDVIGGDRARAASLAEAFYAEHRAELGVSGVYTVASAAEVNTPQVATGLLVAGPIRIKRAMTAGQSPEMAMSAATKEMLSTAYRYAADGGRLTIQRTAERDPFALGWARVTDGHPCYFCAMLASRGPVYKTAQSATRRADGLRYHDGCGCTAEPQYYRNQPWPAGSREYRALWDKVTAGKSGRDAINAFRRAHEGR